MSEIPKAHSPKEHLGRSMSLREIIEVEPETPVQKKHHGRSMSLREIIDVDEHAPSKGGGARR
jgi:hypothetical protein